MKLSGRELWTVVHGMILGAVFLLAFAGGVAGLWSLRPAWVTPDGARERVRRMLVGSWTMAIVCWLTVISGTFVVYPWYRAKPPEGAPVEGYPRSFLLASTDTASWHTLGMEWKEHVAWVSPFLATAVAFVIGRYRTRLLADDRLRRALLVLFCFAFASAAVAGLFGAFINKLAPTR